MTSGADGQTPAASVGALTSAHPPHPPFKVGRVLAVYCFFRGKEAADAGQPIIVCPYVDGTDDPASNLAVTWWRSGWERQQPRAADAEPWQRPPWPLRRK